MKYAATRNFKDGAITRLSPYISRGFITTHQLYQHVKNMDFHHHEKQTLIKELAWRDYFQQVWMAKTDGILQDLNHQQKAVANHGLPLSIVNGSTGIHAIDSAISELYETGYMHNHMRMYVASVCCNIANCHWLQPARWLYSHLLDGDVASNHLSWQWIAGTFSTKKYYANQENINHFFYSKQRNTFLDVDYGELANMDVPEILAETTIPTIEIELSSKENDSIEKNKRTLLYNYYNLDPYWHKNEDWQRILILEPSFFSKYPVGKKCIDFAIQLSKNIEGIKIYVGEFNVLKTELGDGKIIFKEHPAFAYYEGTKESREWMGEIMGLYPSFSSFWKKYQHTLK